MDNTLARWRRSFLAILALAMAWSLYLLIPYRSRLGRWDVLLPVNLVMGTLGVWMLSRRWVCTAGGRLAAGFAYGFGPLTLYLMRFHATAGLLWAVLPWLLAPALHGLSCGSRHRGIRHVLTGFGLALPVMAVFLFSYLTVYLRRFAVPLHSNTASGWQPVLGFLFPCVSVWGGQWPWGTYHVALGPLLVGGAMVFRARRWLILGLAAAGAMLACLPPLGPVSPLLWLAFPYVVGALAVGMGWDGLVYAGRSDRVWLWLVLTVLGGLVLVAVMGGRGSGESGQLYRQGANLYGFAALTIGFVLMAIHLQLRVTWLKSGFLFAALALDLYVSTRYVVGYVL